MSSHRIEAKIEKDGTLVLKDLPFHEGDTVEVVIIPQSSKLNEQARYPFHGKPITYIDPTEPVAQKDWNI